MATSITFMAAAGTLSGSCKVSRGALAAPKASESKGFGNADVMIRFVGTKFSSEVEFYRLVAIAMADLLVSLWDECAGVLGYGAWAVNTALRAPGLPLSAPAVV